MLLVTGRPSKLQVPTRTSFCDSASQAAKISIVGKRMIDTFSQLFLSSFKLMAYKITGANNRALSALKYQCKRLDSICLNAPTIFYDFPKNLINFSTNWAQFKEAFFDESKDKLLALRESYPGLIPELFEKANALNIPLNTRKIEFPYIGVCVGAAFTFLSNFINHPLRDKSPDLAIKDISYFDSMFQEDQVAALHIMQKIIPSKKVPYYSGGSYRRETSNQLFLSLCSMEEKLASLLDLKVTEKRYVTHVENSLKQSLQSLDHHLNDLSSGCYLLGFSQVKEQSSESHLLALIKTSYGKTYLFDPNYATLRFESASQASKGLSRLLKKYYSVKDHSLIIRILKINK